MQNENEQFSVPSGISGLLHPYLQQSRHRIAQDEQEVYNRVIFQRVRKLIEYYTHKNYLIYVEGAGKYFQHIWNRQVQEDICKNSGNKNSNGDDNNGGGEKGQSHQGSSSLEEIILPRMGERFRNVYKDLLNSELEIE